MLESNFWGIIILILYYIKAAFLIALLDLLTSYSREWIRKCYHMLYSFSLFIYLYIFADWYAALLSIIIITIIGIIVLKTAEYFPFLMNLSISRNKNLNEVIKQMIFIHSVFIIFIVVFDFYWKVPNYHAIMGTIIWGFGDAAAAVSGKHFGNSHYKVLLDPSKTIEGTIGFITISFFPAVIFYVIAAPHKFFVSILIAGILVLTGAVIEALTRHGFDTISIPLSITLFSILLEHINNFIF